MGWVHEPQSSLPPYPDLTRLQFLISRLLRLVTWALTNDIAHIMLRASFCEECTSLCSATMFQCGPRRHWFFYTRLVARCIREMGRCVHSSQVLGVKSFFHPVLAFRNLFDSPLSRTWHQFLRRVSFTFNYRISAILISYCPVLLGSWEIYCATGLPLPSGWQSLVIYPTVHCLPYLSNYTHTSIPHRPFHIFHFAGMCHHIRRRGHCISSKDRAGKGQQTY